MSNMFQQRASFAHNISIFGNFDHDSAISCKSGEATFGLCCINLYKGTLVNPAQFHQLQNSGSRNQSLNANQPNVSITNFRCRKSFVW